MGLGFDASGLLNAPTTITPTQWVTDAYQEIYHRAPDDAGRDYWAGVLETSTRAGVVNSFLHAPEFCMVNPNDTLCKTAESGSGGGGGAVVDPDSTLIPGIPDTYVYIGAVAIAAVVVMGMRKK